MFEFIGYKDQVFRADYGWDVVDENGRGGKLVSVSYDTGNLEMVITVQPKLDTNIPDQVTIELKEHEISFVHPPEEV